MLPRRVLPGAMIRVTSLKTSTWTFENCASSFLKILARSSVSAAHPVTYPTEHEYDKEPVYPPHKLSDDQLRHKELCDLIASSPNVIDRQRLVNLCLVSYSKDKRLHRWQWVDPLLPFKITPCQKFLHNYIKYYQYLTKTNVINGLPPVYKNLQVDSSVQAIKDVFHECVQFEVEDKEISRVEKHKEKVGEEFHQRIDGLIEQLIRLVMSETADNEDHLAAAQTDYKPRSQAWWWRGGMPTDNWRGKRDPWNRNQNWYWKDALMFAYYASPSAQVRCTVPLKEHADFNGPESLPAGDALPAYNFDPLAMGLRYEWNPDKAQVKSKRYHNRTYFECVPGFYPKDKNEFVQVAIHNVSKGIYEQETVFLSCLKDELFLAEKQRQMQCAGWMAGFASTLAQAYYQGFTQVHDIAYPLVSQDIVTNGQYWAFTTFQLNCTELVPTDKPRTNIAWASPLLKLYDVDDTTGKLTNFNDEVLAHIFKFFCNKPMARSYEMNPLLPQRHEDYVDLEDRYIQRKFMPKDVPDRKLRIWK